MKFTGAITIKNPVFKLRRQTDRKYFGICLSASGKMIYYHNGKEYISDKNHILLLPKGATYTQSCVEAGEFPLIQFTALEEDAPTEFASIEVADMESYIAEYKKQ